MTDRGLTIEIYSDVVCPWCYIGKRRLEQALASVGGEVCVTWRPFQLNPTMPLDGVDRTTYLEAKFGSLEAFDRLKEQVLAAGVGEGIRFAFEKMQRTPNTFAAHRLVWHAERHGKQDAVVEALFRAYFVEAQDIGNVEALAQVAAQAGLERSETENFLKSDEGVADVKAEEAAGHKLGIRGVPYFVLNQAYGISGAQPVDAFVSAIEKVRVQKSATAEGSASRR
jgi:predicted DsbA family dithiol-disulfide isomerase